VDNPEAVGIAGHFAASTLPDTSESAQRSIVPFSIRSIQHGLFRYEENAAPVDASVQELLDRGIIGNSPIRYRRDPPVL